ncbi:MAG: AMP-binding protein, partial [Algicola sp.]|nr:AMP-binding protein [Algicola sp.]
ATLTGVKTLITAGEAPIKQDVQKLYQQLSYFNAYGPSESSVCATLNRVKHLDANQPISIGKPIKGLAIYLLDQDQQLVPRGIQGEIAISGIGLAQGYWQQRELTAEKFVKVGALGEQQVYLTGDLGYWNQNGELVFVGRKDNQVKLRGHRIELNEVNNTLIDLGVTTDAHTMVINHQGNAKLVAFIVGESSQIVESNIKQQLGEYLPSYMIPHQILSLHRFVMTTNGKIDSDYLKAYALDNSRQTQFLAPVNETETTLVDLFKTTLGLDKVSTDASFFDLGGDSIKAIELVAKLRQLGHTLGSKAVFLHPQPVLLAAHLVASANKTHQVVQQDCVGEVRDVGEIGEVGEVLLSPIQAWFFDTFKQQSHHFNHSEVFFSENRLDIKALKVAMNALIQSFDLLKAKVISLDYNPRLTIDAGEFELPLRLRTLTEQQVDDALMQDQSSFDLSQGPLWQFVVYSTPRGDRLLMCFHHLVIDGISWRLVVQNFNEVYQRALRGEKPSVIKGITKTASFKQFTEAVHQYSQSEQLHNEIGFWQQWADEKYIELKQDKAVAQQQIDCVDAVIVKLSVNETTLLLKETLPQLKATMNEYLLSALAQALTQYRQQEQTLIMMEGHGRDEELCGGLDLSQVVGWFTNAYPLLISSKGDTVVERLLNNRQALGDTPNAGIGFNILKYISPLYGCGERFDYQPNISFNYLGHYSEDKLLDFMTVDKTAPDCSVSGTSELLYPLNINGFIRNGALEFYFGYHTQAFERDTIISIAHRFLQELQQFEHSLPIVEA